MYFVVSRKFLRPKKITYAKTKIANLLSVKMRRPLRLGKDKIYVEVIIYLKQIFYLVYIGHEVVVYDNRYRINTRVTSFPVIVSFGSKVESL